jgi:hypothetical protein
MANPKVRLYITANIVYFLCPLNNMARGFMLEITLQKFELAFRHFFQFPVA